MKKIFVLLLSLVSITCFAQNDFKGVNIFRDTVKLHKQAQYESNRGSLFNPRSLVDKGYVDSSRNKARDSVVAVVTGLKYSKSVTIESPTSTDIIDLFYTDVAITITKVADGVRGTSPSVTYDVVFSTDMSSGSPSELFGTDRTLTSTTGSTTTTFADATIPAGSFVWLKSSANSGTVRSLNLTIIYTED